MESCWGDKEAPITSLPLALWAILSRKHTTCWAGHSSPFPHSPEAYSSSQGSRERPYKAKAFHYPHRPRQGCHGASWEEQRGQLFFPGQGVSPWRVGHSVFSLSSTPQMPAPDMQDQWCGWWSWWLTPDQAAHLLSHSSPCSLETDAPVPTMGALLPLCPPVTQTLVELQESTGSRVRRSKCPRRWLLSWVAHSSRVPSFLLLLSLWICNPISQVLPVDGFSEIPSTWHPAWASHLPQRTQSLQQPGRCCPAPGIGILPILSAAWWAVHPSVSSQVLPVHLGSIHPLSGATEPPENKKTEVAPGGISGRQSIGTTIPLENCAQQFGSQVGRKLWAGAAGQEEPRGWLGESWWERIFLGEVRGCRSLRRGLCRGGVGGWHVTLHLVLCSDHMYGPWDRRHWFQLQSVCPSWPNPSFLLEFLQNSAKGALSPKATDQECEALGLYLLLHLQPGLHMASLCLGWALSQDRPRLTLRVLNSQSPAWGSAHSTFARNTDRVNLSGWPGPARGPLSSECAHSLQRLALSPRCPAPPLSPSALPVTPSDTWAAYSKSRASGSFAPVSQRGISAWRAYDAYRAQSLAPWRPIKNGRSFPPCLAPLTVLLPPLPHPSPLWPGWAFGAGPVSGSFPNKRFARLVNRRKHNPGRGKTGVCKHRMKAQGVGPQWVKYQFSEPFSLIQCFGASVMVEGGGFAQLQKPQPRWNKGDSGHTGTGDQFCSGHLVGCVTSGKLIYLS